MELSIFLAKLFGLYFLLMSLVFITKRREVGRMVHAMARKRVWRYFGGALEIIIGLAVVVGHPIWGGWPLVITLLGYGMIAEGVFYLVAPAKTIRKIGDRFTRPTWYTLSILVTAILGVILVVYGFGGF